MCGQYRVHISDLAAIVEEETVIGSLLTLGSSPHLQSCDCNRDAEPVTEDLGIERDHATRLSSLVETFGRLPTWAAQAGPSGLATSRNEVLLAKNRRDEPMSLFDQNEVDPQSSNLPETIPVPHTRPPYG